MSIIIDNIIANISNLCVIIIKLIKYTSGTVAWNAEMFLQKVHYSAHGEVGEWLELMEDIMAVVGGAPAIYKLVVSPWTIEISPVNHSDIGVAPTI